MKVRKEVKGRKKMSERENQEKERQKKETKKEERKKEGVCEVLKGQ